MRHQKGGKKRSDKYKGRRSAGRDSAALFSRMISGQVNTAAGEWLAASRVKLDNWSQNFYSELPSTCQEHTDRNKAARARRGKKTGRRPPFVKMEEWQRQISGGKKPQPEANNE